MGWWEKISQSEFDALKTALKVAKDYDGKISQCSPYKFINNALFIEELENFIAEIARRYYITEGRAQRNWQISRLEKFKKFIDLEAEENA